MIANVTVVLFMTIAHLDGNLLQLFGNPIMYDGAQQILQTIAENDRSSVSMLDIRV